MTSNYTDQNYDPNGNEDTASINDNNIVSRKSIDITSGQGLGNAPMTNQLMGYNHRFAATPVPKNREMSGLRFFTRPDMNLNQQNLSVSRRLQEMADSNPSSVNYAILAALDPLNEFTAAAKSVLYLGGPLKKTVPFDNKQAFIPLLTNACISLSGMPENTVDTYTSEEGLRREQISFVDSTYEINNVFTANATFRNMDRDPVTKMFSVWLEYMAGVYTGDMVPRGRNVLQSEIDYQTRIYSLNMDPTNRYVTRISAFNAAFPLNDNVAAMMNYDATNPYLTSADQISIQFQCAMCEHGDPILYQEFNDVVGMFNSDMLTDPNSGADWYPVGKDVLRKLRPAELLSFNYYGYPHINVLTKELEWYVYADEYDYIRGVEDVKY